MEDTPDFVPQLLTDYLAGEISTENRVIVEDWLAQHPSRRTMVQRWRQVWDAARHRAHEGATRSTDIAMVTHSVAAHIVRIRGTDRAQPATGTSSSLSRVHAPKHTPQSLTYEDWFPSYLRVPSVIVATLLVLMCVVLFNRHISDNSISARTSSTYATARGYRATVTLADGTTIVLAPETKMHINTLTSGARTVELDGAAVFAVAHADRNAFIVQTAGTSVRVLGTTFGVRHYRSDPVTRVAVREGKVAVNTIALVAGDLSELHADGMATVSHHANLSAMLDWVNGSLVFHNAPLSDVAAQLSRWYNVDIVLADTSLSALPFTLTVQQESLRDVLASIARAADVQVVRRGNIVTISSSNERTID